MNPWSAAKEMAINTPTERNRYVDALRAVSILVVVCGHWLIAGFHYLNASVESIQVLAVIPSTQPLTWIFQVMPIFFIVGGYSNAVSLQSAARKNTTYAQWLATRLDRLIRPLLPLVGLWGAIALLLPVFEVQPQDIQMLTQIALIPIWFLAIYILTVLLAPLTYRAWGEFGLNSFIGFAALAIIVDLAVFTLGTNWLSWTNYLWVWLGVHQLGYAWQANKFSCDSWKNIAAALIALATLVALVALGPYPLAMVGSPDPEISNTLAPKITLLALAIAQFSLVLFFEARANRLLEKVQVWTAAVLVNSMIMTLYLWHITIMLLIVFVSWLLGGIGLTLEPGTLDWWLTRPLWIGLLFSILAPVSLMLSPIERSGRPSQWATRKTKLLLGAILICIGIALMAMFGIGNASFSAFSYLPVALVFLGAWTSGVLGIGRRPRI